MKLQTGENFKDHAMEVGGLRFHWSLELGCGVFAASVAPLADAAERQDLATIRVLLHDSAVNAAQVDGMTALHWAVLHDDLATARALIGAHADPQVTNRYGVTPLSLACTNGASVMVTLLLDAGADPNLALHGGETPLMTAARTGRLDVVQALLARGPRPTRSCPRARPHSCGRRPRVMPPSSGHWSPRAPIFGPRSRAALRRCCSPCGPVMRMSCASCSRPASTSTRHAPKATKLTNKELRRGASALSLAIENGRFELAALLLDLGRIRTTSVLATRPCISSRDPQARPRRRRGQTRCRRIPAT